MKLSELLLDKFKDYQIIVLTHEKDWFDLMNHSVKGKGWYINVIKWSREQGAYFEPSLVDIKATIEKKINNNEEAGLGVLIRKYLEKILKDTAEALEIRMPYRSNERNEQRMCGEMLSYLKSDLNKQPCKEIFDKKTSTILNNSLFIGDKASHYDSFQPSIGDCKAFWEDVKSLESLFFCQKCHKSIAIKYYDMINKKIRCGCGELQYEWKK